MFRKRYWVSVERSKFSTADDRYPWLGIVGYSRLPFGQIIKRGRVVHVALGKTSYEACIKALDYKPEAARVRVEDGEADGLGIEPS